MPTPAPFSPFKLAVTGLYILAWPALIMFLSGDCRWREGWIFCAWFTAMSFANTAWLYLKDPALLAERYRRPGTGGQSGRDFVTVAFIMLGFLSWLVLLPLDARRFHWSPPAPLGVEVAGAVLLAPAWFFLFRAFADNTYASGLVRIQKEREHRLVSTGVYAIVRHPMYLGAVLMFVGGALLTGAAAALGVAVANTLILVVRIGDEERLLGRDLPGYDAYRQKVRYRLLPYLW